MSEVTSVIPGASAVHSPRVTSTIFHENAGTVVEEEIVAVRVTGVYSEVPVACVPIQRTVEIARGNVGTVLPVEENITQIEVALLPITAVEVIVRVYSHKVVEVDFIGSLILCVGEIEFIRHLVGEEQSLLACLFVTHGL